jgi:hypothetical protein
MINILYTIIFIILIFVFLYLNKNNIIYIESNLGTKFIIYKDNNKNEKANLIAQIVANMYILRDYLYDNINNYPDFKESIIQLKNNFNKNRTSVYETDPNIDLTSYSVNKGEELSICLQDKNTNKLYDINLLMYVIVHEMSHFACSEIGHGDLFQKIFNKFLLVAMEINLYKKIDFVNNPVNYCGLILNSSII